MLNRVIMMGRLAHTPEVKDGELTVARIRLAVPRDIKGKDGVDTDFFDVSAFGKTADFVKQYLAKGRLIVVEGRLQTRQYTDKDNNKRIATQVIADRIYFADSPKKDEPTVTLKPTPPMKPETKAFGDQMLENMKTPLVPVMVDDDELPPF